MIRVSKNSSLRPRRSNSLRLHFFNARLVGPTDQTQPRIVSARDAALGNSCQLGYVINTCALLYSVRTYPIKDLAGITRLLDVRLFLPSGLPSAGLRAAGFPRSTRWFEFDCLCTHTPDVDLFCL